MTAAEQETAAVIFCLEKCYQETNTATMSA